MSDELHQVLPVQMHPVMADEACIAKIISLMCPKDACLVAPVSPVFQSAANSDFVWERFLPSIYQEIISRASSNVEFSTKKQLYFLLRRSALLLDEGTMSCQLTGKSEESGDMWYKIGARKLQITSSDDPNCWGWGPSINSSFTEIALLQSINMLEIGVIMQARMLSPNTTYEAWFIFMTNYGGTWIDVPLKASIKFVKEDGTETEGETNTIYLEAPRDYDGPMVYSLDDDWNGIKFGEFLIGEEDTLDIHILIAATEFLTQKHGLYIEGLVLAPKKGG